MLLIWLALIDFNGFSLWSTPLSSMSQFCISSSSTESLTLSELLFSSMANGLQSLSSSLKSARETSLFPLLGEELEFYRSNESSRSSSIDPIVGFLLNFPTEPSVLPARASSFSLGLESLVRSATSKTFELPVKLNFDDLNISFCEIRDFSKVLSMQVLAVILLLKIEKRWFWPKPLPFSQTLSLNRSNLNSLRVSLGLSSCLTFMSSTW